MMRSLFSGVSGLKSHQTRMDTIGNNIANVNTTGFKSSRTTFADTLSQTLTGASAPGDTIGGTNAKQIGLGTGVASIDTIFTDGSVQSTGKNTDLCLSGNGLFVVKKGDQTYYTRDGAFEFDAAGNYVMSGSGLYVQGWSATDGKLNSTGAVGNLTINSGKQMKSKETTTATYSNNLNASTDGSKISTITVNYADGSAATTGLSSYTPTAVAAGTVSLTLSGSGEVVTLDNTADYDFTTGDSVNGKTLYTSKIQSVTANATGGVKLSLGTGSTVNSISGLTPVTINSGTYKIGDTYKITGTIQTNGVTTSGTNSGETVLTVKLTDAANNGSVATIKVPNPTNFTYSDGDTVSFDLPITEIDADTGAVVNEANGKSDTLTAALNVTSADQKYKRTGTATDGTVTTIARTGSGTSYTYNGKEVASVAIVSTDATTSAGLTGATYTAGNMFYPSVTTTVTAYDSQGRKYAVPVLFTKTAANTWSLSLAGGGTSTTVTNDNGDMANIDLDSKTLTFDSDGKYVSGEASLLMSYNTGSETQSVTANLAGLTQYAGNSTINASADGNAAGTLSSVAIDSTGTITGTYTNGVKQTEAQVAVAQFNNASGLTKTGNSLYQESNNSGTANVKTASDLGVSITPSALEMSNVDIANEFSDMIITQRGFQSNSKIITVGDEMLETLINMKR
jgi:flagellar hook protein FlgE